MGSPVVDRELWGRRIVDIYGLGALGSYTAQHLCSRGVPEMRGIDDDVVAPHNFLNQAFLVGSEGQKKGAAVQALITWRQDLLGVTATNFEFEDRRGGSDEPLSHVVFVLPDNMTARKGLAKSAQRSARTEVLFEARVASGDAPQIRIYCLDPRSRRQFTLYEQSLYGDEIADQSAGCRDSVDSSIGHIAAGLIAQTFDRWWGFVSQGIGDPPYGETIFFPRTMEIINNPFSR